jgi:hypothetical protein
VTFKERDPWRTAPRADVRFQGNYGLETKTPEFRLLARRTHSATTEKIFLPLRSGTL